MKMIKLVFLWVLVMALTGCASLLVSKPRGSGQSNGSSISSDDARMTNQINAALIREPGISSLDVYVNTHQGVVTLKGYISSHKMKNRASDVAASVAGVKSVRNQLRLK